MDYLLFAKDMNILEICYDKSFLDKGLFKTYDQIIKENIVYDKIEYAFGTWGVPSFTSAEIKRYFPALKAFFYGAGTVQYFARPFLQNGVRVFSSWGANAIPVAEYTVAQIVLSNKGFFKLQDTFSQQGHNAAKDIAAYYPGNYKTKVGLLGAGMIGKLVINLLKNYDLDILVFDPFMSNEKAAELGVIKSDLNTIFSECRTISNHLAKNDKTNGLITYEQFSKMQDYSTFINTARGSIINEEDLKKSLRENPTRTAILDVLDPNEQRDISDDIFTLKNCIITPHIAGSQTKERKRLGQFMVNEYKSLLDNQTVKYEVTLKDLETMA
jgi:phosphoglycerate dehydrogenase-like enzyme